MQVVELLTKAKAAITDENHWTQGAYGEDQDGHTVGMWGGKAPVKMCAIGAILYVSGAYEFDAIKNERGGAWTEEVHQAEELLDQVANGSSNPHRTMIGFNDDDRTQHKDVLAAYDRAIELAKT